MREIKFRALGLSGFRKGKMIFGTNKIEKYFDTDKRDTHLSLVSFERLMNGDILDKNTRALWTGEVDNTGKEIYEDMATI